MSNNSTFSELLTKLVAEHNRVLSENADLKAEIAALGGRPVTKGEGPEGVVPTTSAKVKIAGANQEDWLDVSSVQSVQNAICFPCSSVNSSRSPWEGPARPSRWAKCKADGVHYRIKPEKAKAGRLLDNCDMLALEDLPGLFPVELKNPSRLQKHHFDGEPTSPTSAMSPTSNTSVLLVNGHSQPSYNSSFNSSPSCPSSKREQLRRLDLLNPLKSDSVEEDDLALWPDWEEEQGQVGFAKQRRLRPSQAKGMALTPSNGESHRGGDQLREDSCLQPLVCSPDSKKRAVWDMLSVFVVFYDVLTVPLLAFSAMDSPGVVAIGLFTTIFWTVDIPLSFLHGFHNGGLVEMRPRRIALRYMKQWFLMDIFVVSVDFALLFLQTGLTEIIGMARGPKVVRLLRLVRVVRLLRIIKIPALIDNLLAHCDSEALTTAVQISRSLCLLGVVNHFIACGWYGVSLLPEERGLSWVNVMDAEERGMAYRYTTALHWSLTQFTPASMEVMPRNTAERLYTIFVLLGAMVTFSTFVSSITTAMTTLRVRKSEQSKQTENWRRYIAENQISIELARRMSTYIKQHSLIAKNRVHESDIKAFKALPETLQVQVHWEVYSRRLMSHPIFHQFNEAPGNGVWDLCHKAMSEQSLFPTKDLFVANKKAESAFLIHTGMMKYIMCESIGVTTVDVLEGQWVCEVALWIKWLHTGRLSASTNCELLVLDAATFRRIAAESSPEVHGALCLYAKTYREYALGSMFQHETAPLEVRYEFDTAQELAQDAFSELEAEKHVSDAKARFRMEKTHSQRGFLPALRRHVTPS